MDCFGLRETFFLCFGVKNTKSKTDHDYGKGQAVKFMKNKVVPLPLSGTLHINTPKENQENILRQLEEEGVVAKRRVGGVTFDVGAKCQQFNIVERQPRCLQAFDYDAQERELMAYMMKQEILKRKGEFARVSEARRKMAAERRETTRNKILQRMRIKQDRYKERMEKRKKTRVSP